MKSIIEELNEYNNLWIRSKIKFQWDFNDSLANLISELEVAISKQIISNYKVEYSEYWKQDLKIKVKDKNIMLEKLITCNLFHSKNDEIYWYITPKFSSSEKWQKTKKYELEKFELNNNESIIKWIIIKLIEIIEEF